MTDYDPATVTVVRTQFDSRVDKVLVDLGTTGQERRPSARAVQHGSGRGQEQLRGGRQPVDTRQGGPRLQDPAGTGNALPRKELIEVKNDEAQSRLKMKLAKDKLLVYGLSEKEIESCQDRGRQGKGQDDPAVACRWRRGLAERCPAEIITRPRTY